MIDELKVLLDMLGNVDDIALYVLFGFAMYKLVIYLSTTGAIVMLIRLGIVKLHDAITRDKTVVRKANTGRLFMDDDQWTRIEDAMIKYTNTQYIHRDQANKILNAVKKGLKDDNE